ncbi:Helix-destabilising protein [Acidovorax sp. CF316]|uniref:single-stranded DNA-binding protein n=1 Tax=Acidovorax sp. CF316 TaxID=1144317 RepID=UPI00026BDB0C|nr:single-stranded DNA-binding protein [Acidovorax sp. CF316]EJE52912.1 Helix-destabilising protein [Acidovorax sp. CF316]
MIKVSVTSTDVRNQSGTAKASGKAYSLNFQTVYFHTHDRTGKPNPYPEKVEIILEKNEQGAALFYPAGEYTLAPESIYVDRTGNLAISAKLNPVKVAPAASARPAA